MRRMVVAAAALGASGLLAACSGEAEAEAEPSAVGPTADVSEALGEYEPSLDGYTLYPAQPGGNDVYRMRTAGGLDEMPMNPEECTVFNGAQSLTIADDPDGFPDDVGVNYGWLAPADDEMAEDYELRARQFVTPELPAQLAQTVLDDAPACAEYEQIDPVTDEVWNSLTDVTAEAVTLEGVAGRAVRIDYTVDRGMVFDGEGEFVMTDRDYHGVMYLYPYGRVMVSLSTPSDADTGEVATIISDLIAYLDEAA